MSRCSSSWLGHKWEWSSLWNSGVRSIFTGDVIARSGNRCFHCGEMSWDITDEEFYAQLKKSGVIREEEIQ